MIVIKKAVRVSEEAERAARDIGLLGNAQRRLRRMAERSAKVTHAQGNRRFDEFVLKVEDGVVLTVSRL